MTCRMVQRSLSAFSDGRMTEPERSGISSHLAQCPECSAVAERQSYLVQALRALPMLNPPARLSTSLRVLVSRELARRRSRKTAGTLALQWFSRIRLRFENMMQPLAVPLAGGLLSAVILFGILVPTFSVPVTHAADDVPTALYTEASVRELGPFDLGEDDIVLDLTVNQEGRVVDYSTPGGRLSSPQAKRKVENMLLFTVFSPITNFGQPLSGKVRITLGRSAIDVIG